MIATLPDIVESVRAKGEFPGGPLVRSPEELRGHGLREEMAIALADAKVVWADYDLLRHDFPELGDAPLSARHPELAWLDGTSRERRLHELIDAWLIRNAAFISRRQAEQEEVNTPIAVTRREVLAYRPLKYGRALVLSLRNNHAANNAAEIEAHDDDARNGVRGHDGLLDVKGAGCAPDATPAVGTHMNGLLKLSDGLIELLNQRLIRRALRHGGSHVDTVPIYALIDPGFDIREHDDRAALLVRRAHLRPVRSGGLAPYGSAAQIVQLETELFLRRYGISASNPVTRVSLWREDGSLKIRYGRTMITFCTPEQLDQLSKAAYYSEGLAHYDGVNIQHVRDVELRPMRTQLVDFGTYRVHARFDHPVLSLVSDKLMRWGGTIRPGSPRFVQPEPAIAVPYELWGAGGSTHGYAGSDDQTKQDTLCEGLAADYRRGILGRDDIRETLDAFLAAATARW